MGGPGEMLLIFPVILSITEKDSLTQLLRLILLTRHNMNVSNCVKSKILKQEQLHIVTVMTITILKSQKIRAWSDELISSVQFHLSTVSLCLT